MYKSFGKKSSLGQWNEKRTENITLNATDIMYCYKPESTLYIALIHFLIIDKYHIFQSWLNESPPSLKVFCILRNFEI